MIHSYPTNADPSRVDLAFAAQPEPPLTSLNERHRMEILRHYALLDTGPEPELDKVTEMAAHVCAAPIALLSLVDSNRQWFKSVYGVKLTETPRSQSFCAHALDQPDLLIVPDATKDDRFSSYDLVTGSLGVRFYVGAPLITPNNATLGTLCVMDIVPRELTETQKWVLTTLSRQIMQRFERHRRCVEFSLTEDGLLPPGVHDYTLSKLGRLVCTNPHRAGLWHRLLGFLAGLILKRQFSSAHLSGSFISNDARPSEIDITLQTTEPYNPSDFSPITEFLVIGPERIYETYSIRLRFWVENLPMGIPNTNSFFDTNPPWTRPGGPTTGIVRLDLANPSIVDQYRKALSPNEDL